MAKNTNAEFFATLKAHPGTKSNASPGFTIVFEPARLSAETIKLRKAEIELALNKYLEENVDATANNLLVPFNSRMVATKNPMVHSFKAKVFTKGKLKKAFAYPSEPLKKIDGFVLELTSPPTDPPSSPSPATPQHIPLPPPPDGSHVNTVTIKAPPN